MGIELVIFDMDGLMFDTERVIYNEWADIIRQMGKEPTVRLFSRSMGGHEPEITEHYTTLLGRDVSMEEILDIFHRADSAFPAILARDGIGVKKGLFELLEWLKNQHINKVIASSTIQETIRHYLNITDVEAGQFIDIVSGDMVKKRKPDPEIFLLACERAGVLPQNALVLEDSRNGLKAAVAAGIPCIFVPDIIVPDEEIEEKAFKVAESLLEVIDIIAEMQ